MSRRRALAAAAGTAALLAGCAVAAREPLEPDVEPPAAWREAAPADAAAAPGAGPWWRAFDAPELTAAVEEALAANRDLEAAAARVLAAAARARVAGADRLPSVTATLDRTRAQNVFVGFPIPGSEPLSTTSTSWRAALEVSWELDLWGRIAAGRDAAAADLAAAGHDAVAARHSVAARTARAWLAWVEAAAQERLGAERAGSFARTAAIVRDRYDEGVASAFDLRLAEANAARAEAALAGRVEARARAFRALEALLGRAPADAPETAPPLPEPPPRVPPGLPAELLERRPDLAAAAARVRAADERAEAARAALLPALRLTGSAGRLSDEAEDLFDPDFDVWSLGTGIAQPLFQGGRLRAAADAEEARALEALAEFEGAFLVALGEVEAALAAEEALARFEAELAAAADAADAAYELALDRYVAGRATLLSVLDAQRSELDVDAERLAARRRRLGARVDLHLALGGGFEEPAR